jgi:dimethylhistidine N-methyltransferase
MFELLETTTAAPELTDLGLTDFAEAVLTGLAQTQKVIPARYFYDTRGSELFEDITRLPEYYPTRVETALLRTHAEQIANLCGRGRALIEFGSGSSVKTPLLLGALAPSTYVPIDIAEEFLHTSSAALAADHPGLRVTPVAGDFTRPLPLPEGLGEQRIGFFPGSTIGNCSHGDAVDLLRAFRATLGDGARLVIGIDTRKNPRMLEAAYDDAAGITAEFNRNLLVRINRELDADIPVEAFEHRAVWNDLLGRIEMHLVASQALAFTVLGRKFAFAEDETIHTENSTKYTLEEARLLARVSGWEPLACWTDKGAMFGLHVWAASGDAMQP